MELFAVLFEDNSYAALLGVAIAAVIGVAFSMSGMGVPFVTAKTTRNSTVARVTLGGP